MLKIPQVRVWRGQRYPTRVELATLPVWVRRETAGQVDGRTR